MAREADIETKASKPAAKNKVGPVTSYKWSYRAPYQWPYKINGYSNWCYNPTYRGYNPIDNWSGAHLEVEIDYTCKVTVLLEIHPFFTENQLPN